MLEDLRILFSSLLFGMIQDSQDSTCRNASRNVYSDVFLNPIELWRTRVGTSQSRRSRNRPTGLQVHHQLSARLA